MGEIKEGDIVQPKSGGPKMTVHFIDDIGQVWCAWFIDEKPQSHPFAKDDLEPLSPDDTLRDFL